MLKNFNKRIFIALLVTISIVLVLIWATIFFLGNKVKESFEKYQKEKLNSLVLEEKRNKILKLGRDLPDLEKDKESLEAMLLKKDMAVPLLRTLEKIAADTSCSIEIQPADISKIKFASASKQASKSEDDAETEEVKGKKIEATAQVRKKEADELESLKKHPAFSIEVVGHFSALVDFFEKFENVSYFLRPLIIDFSVVGKSSASPSSMPASPESENQEEKNVKMTMTFIVYTQQ